ncbi:MAG: CTP synthase, partial [Patescibacteria group bacterium]
KERFAVYCNIHADDVISNPDMPSVYEVPIVLDKQQIVQKIEKKLSLPKKQPKLAEWETFLKKVRAKKSKTVEITIIGKYFGTGNYQLKDSYAAMFDAIDHACWHEGVNVKTHWVSAQKIEKEGVEIIGKPDGIIVPIGWGERGAEGMIAAAGYARRKKIPYLGLCFGMQLSVVSFAREVLGWKDANTTENDPKSKHQVIHLIPSQKELMERRAYGGTMRLGGWEAMIKKGTIAYHAYKKYSTFLKSKDGLTSERHRHRYEFNDEYAAEFEKAGLIISARSVAEKLVEIVELSKKDHPFYLGTQGHPEYKSRPLAPHPLFIEFIQACKR